MMIEPKIYVGTSGWSYPAGEGTWKGFFYSPGEKDELAYYARFFNTVEINTTFYRCVQPNIAKSWARRVPDGFIFTAKLWQKFTHPKMFEQATGEVAAVSAADIDLFKAGIEPLASSEKMGALLAQFPPSFINDDSGRQRLGAIIKTFGEYHLAVELRHKSWSDDPNAAQMLKDSKVAWVQIDEPKFSFSLGRNVPQTSDLSYFRFHGRNKEMWWKGDNEQRYRYLYSIDEIQELAEKVKSSSESSKVCFVFFNNHWQAYAPRNAGDLIKALQLPFTDLPIPRLLQKD